MGKPTFGSLFAGIGGLDLGLERAGFECKWQVEIDPYAQKVLHKHWPDVPKFEDVREFPPIGDFKVDLICGGFPCQDISYAGKGAGLDGERSGLFYELIRVVSLVGPKFVLLENVSALLTRGLDQVLGTLASIGYDAEWHCISAAHVGAPHIRDRVFILAYSQSERHGKRREAGNLSKENGKQIGPMFTEPCGTDKRLKMLADTESQRLEGLGNSSAIADSRSGERHPWTKVGEGWEWWSVEPDVGRMAYGVPSRVDRLRGLGNAVVPQVAEYIGKRIIQSINH